MKTTLTMSLIHSLVSSGLLQLHHTSWYRGYVSRRPDSEIVQFYRGRFGFGFRVLSSSHRSSYYCHVSYYIFNDGFLSLLREVCSKE